MSHTEGAAFRSTNVTSPQPGRPLPLVTAWHTVAPSRLNKQCQLVRGHRMQIVLPPAVAFGEMATAVLDSRAVLATFQTVPTDQAANGRRQ